MLFSVCPMNKTCVLLCKGLQTLPQLSHKNSVYNRARSISMIRKMDYSRTRCQRTALQIHSDINLCEHQPITACGGAQKKCALALLSVTSNTLDWWCARYQLSAGWLVHSLWQERNACTRVITDWKSSEILKTFAGFSLVKCCLKTIQPSSVYRLCLQFSSGSFFHSFPRLAFCFYDKLLSIRDTASLMRKLEGMDSRGPK